MAIELVAVVVLLALAAIAILARKVPVATETYPYRAADHFLSPAELSFFRVLRQATGDDGIVFAKVRVADVINTNRGLNASNRQTAFNKIQAKHFDFVICTPDDVSPIVAVELDDSTHKRRTRVKRDEFLNRVCEASDLPLLRVPAARSYSIAQLREMVMPLITGQGRDARLVVESSVVNQQEIPDCPRCESPMVRRLSKRGKNAGEEFWGCVNFPRCKQVLRVDA